MPSFLPFMTDIRSNAKLGESHVKHKNMVDTETAEAETS